MLLTEIDHVAIAVNDLEAAIDYTSAPLVRLLRTEKLSSKTASKRLYLKLPKVTCSC